MLLFNRRPHEEHADLLQHLFTCPPFRLPPQHLKAITPILFLTFVTGGNLEYPARPYLCPAPLSLAAPRWCLLPVLSNMVLLPASTLGGSRWDPSLPFCENIAVPCFSCVRAKWANRGFTPRWGRVCMFPAQYLA